jgi:actin related protein 2/3 complex subunit 5
LHSFNPKSRNLALVVSVLSSVKPSDVGDLSSYDMETICKYVYEGFNFFLILGMKFPNEYNTSSLLAWHEKLTEAGGLGLIVRVITDVNTV